MIKSLHLYLILAICSCLIGRTTEVLANTNKSEPAVTNISFVQQKSEQADSTLLSNRNVQQAELDAFFNSKYNYCDTKLLSQYWGQSILDTKARIGRKVLWGDGGIPYLEQYLVNARMEAIREQISRCNFAHEGYTYDDAVALSQFWGDSSPWEAKQRIENNLMLGNQEEIDSALRKLGRR